MTKRILIPFGIAWTAVGVSLLLYGLIST